MANQSALPPKMVKLLIATNYNYELLASLLTARLIKDDADCPHVHFDAQALNPVNPVYGHMLTYPPEAEGINNDQIINLLGMLAGPVLKVVNIDGEFLHAICAQMIMKEYEDGEDGEDKKVGYTIHNKEYYDEILTTEQAKELIAALLKDGHLMANN